MQTPGITPSTLLVWLCLASSTGFAQSSAPSFEESEDHTSKTSSDVSKASLDGDSEIQTEGDAKEKIKSTAQDQERGLDLELIVITGVGVRKRTLLNNSVSVSNLSGFEIGDFTPRSTAEIFRNIPGIRSESSGGENNANIQVRGLPVTTGGAKFVQLQEDGLPVLAFGDITFGNADNFLRYDSTVQRIEVIRGGSASTFASNAPGAVINFISQDGEVEGGEIGVTRGLNFDTTRVDFGYGSPFAGSWQFHIGGFYRVGEGPREAGFIAEEGGQVKASLTRNFMFGHIRLSLKHLNDRTIPYLPAPVRIVDGEVEPLEQFDFRKQALATRYLQNNTRIDSNGTLNFSDIPDGVRSVSNAVGLEFEFDLGDNWTLANRGRFSANNGSFTGSFAASVDDVSSVLTAFEGTDLRFHNGPNAGSGVSDVRDFSNLVVQNLLFDVSVNDLSHFVNELRLSKKIESSIGNFDISAGYYKSIQNVETEWSFNTYLQEARGDNAALINVVDANGSLITTNGVATYGGFDPYFDLNFNRDALFGFLSYNNDRLTLEASIRYEAMQGKGTSNLGAPAGGPGSFVSINTDDNEDGIVSGAEVDLDVDRDGRISRSEVGIGVVDRGNLFNIDYRVDYISYSFGANFLFTKNLAAFARYSLGASSNGDRLLLGGQGFNLSGDLMDDELAVDAVRQAEVGLKFQGDGQVIPGRLALFITGFFADSEESNFEVTSGRAFDRKVQSYGVEVETAYRIGAFSITGGVTATDAEITDDSTNPDNVGNRPRRQAVAIYQATAAWSDYAWDRLYSFGVNMIGTTSSFAQDNNDFKLPGFTQVNMFVNFDLVPQMTLSFNVNNAFNVFGLTEAEEGTVPENGIVRARPINGRTMSASLKYQF